MSLLDIPLDVWFYYGDEAISQLLRMSCRTLRPIARQDSECVWAYPITYKMGRFIMVRTNDYWIISDKNTTICTVETLDPRETYCVLNVDGRPYFWTGTARELRHRLDAVAGRGFCDSPRDLKYIGVHYHDFIDTRTSTMFMEIGVQTTTSGYAPTFTCGGVMLTRGDFMEYLYVVGRTIYTSSQRIPAGVRIPIWQVM